MPHKDFELATYVPTQLEFAELVGMSERQIRALVAQGWLTKGAPLHRLVSEYRTYRDEARRRHG